MPNIYLKKTDRVFNPEDMKNAVREVLHNKKSIRECARQFNITKSRLTNYVRKAKNVGFENIEFERNYIQSQILTVEMETALEKYLIQSCEMFYGLTPNRARRLAYEYAVRNNRKVPDKWKQEKMASKSWLTSFMNRHPRLSVRKPEATRLARMTSFNRNNVEVFQNKLEDLFKRYSFTSAQIFNLDETGVTTVKTVQKVIGKKEEHQIGKVTSRERGELMTHVGIICANGNALPPVWIFPRRRFDKARMMQGIPEINLGLAYPSGWMTCENFLKVLEHFVKNVRCSVTNRVLLIMDNHESHISLDAVEFCRSNGIVILTLPPHTSNKIQPLDRTVFGPFKTFFNQAADSWMLSHPGQILTIYDLPLMCLQSWDRAANPVNIKSGFRCTGIVPFDKNIFGDEDFACSSVTDRPLPDPDIGSTSSGTTIADSTVLSDTPTAHNVTLRERTPSPNIINSHQSKQKNSFTSPELIQPFSKASARKQTTNRGRGRGRCMIATDTPEKREIEARTIKIKDRKKKKEVKRKVLDESSSDEEKIEIEYQDRSSDDSINFEDDMQINIDVSKGDFIITKVHGKACVRNYVAVIDGLNEEGHDVRFLKKNTPSNRFSFAKEPPATVDVADVVAVLPKPIEDRHSRFIGMLYFNIDLSEYGLQ